MNQVGNIRKKGGGNPRMQEWLQFDDQLFKGVAEVIEAGKRDGSIRQDMDSLQGCF